jgi:NTE family protein
MASFRAKTRSGAYWGVRSDIAEYEVPDALPCPPEKTLALANIKTRLKRLESVDQERLINWGYAICDAAVRKWVDSSLGKPIQFPYPASGI